MVLGNDAQLERKSYVQAGDEFSASGFCHHSIASREAQKNRVSLMLIYSGGDTRYAGKGPHIAELMPVVGPFHALRQYALRSCSKQ